MNGKANLLTAWWTAVTLPIQRPVQWKTKQSNETSRDARVMCTPEREAERVSCRRTQARGNWRKKKTTQQEE